MDKIEDEKMQELIDTITHNNDVALVICGNENEDSYGITTAAHGSQVVLGKALYDLVKDHPVVLQSLAMAHLEHMFKESKKEEKKSEEDVISGIAKEVMEVIKKGFENAEHK